MAQGVVVNAKQVIQIRVKPSLKWPFNKHPIYYDSAVLFTNPEAAKKATGPYIQDLIEKKILDPKRPYEVELLVLKILNLPLESRTDVENAFKE